MSIQAAQRMGLRCRSLDPGSDTPASQVADALVGRLDDVERLGELVTSCEYLTLENEFVPAAAISAALDLAQRPDSVLTPGLATLATIQDKLRQRRAFAAAGVPSPSAVRLDEYLAGAHDLGWPVVLKARFGGYDGKGTRTCRDPQSLAATVATLTAPDEWLAESFVPFRRELAVMVFVGKQVGTFPTMETVQKDHVCDLVFQAGVDASEIALAAVQAVEGRGLFGVELFELDSGEIQVNEIAPRPHNTGHYTLDWGATSQFEQHVRLAMGWPVDAQPRGRAVAMANLLGREGSFDLRAATQAALRVPGVHVHWYGKRELRPGRKMGHLNAVGDLLSVRATVTRAREAFFAVGLVE